MLLFLIYGQTCFEKAVYYCLIFGTIGSTFSLITGFYDWKTKYKGARAPLLLEKRNLAIILVMLNYITFTFKTIIPDIMYSDNIVKWIYILLIFSFIPITVRIGYLGGKLVFK
jgi:uncharacterized membrane protein